MPIKLDGDFLAQETAFPEVDKIDKKEIKGKKVVMRDYKKRFSKESKAKYGTGDFYVILIEDGKKRGKFEISGMAVMNQLEKIEQRYGKKRVQEEGVEICLTMLPGEKGDYWSLI